ncbi:ATP-binding protein [Lewinella sp. 4G2]|uniref:ATP-binding protein n=1 Tax=Lewinella sp. 4G2 TaxID=1803372 RepID=UPI0007B470A8|nr:DUF499 domain-containing protein [Lewinella sp. 4G2]OAV44066.1 hypothetical protein A3850_005945 [Lewinella sp. 4G2]
MKSWFNVVRPHEDIRRGELAEAVFAANLAEVAAHRGPEVYRDPDIFFAKTYFTAGLRNLAKQVILGLNGNTKSGNRVISLQTGFGGGKTHSLISLFHLATLGSAANAREDLADLLAHTGPIGFEIANYAVFTNTTNDPAQGREEKGTHIQTLWGELAYQLGGAKAYERVRKNDELRSAPKGIFKDLLEDCAPALILIDELADYCVSASAIEVGGADLSSQTVSFMQELTEAVAAVPGVVMVATLPASVTEVAASEKGAAILNSLASRLARVGKDTKPVDGDEIYEVICRRLFEDIGPREEHQKVAAGYVEYYKKQLKEAAPSETRKAKYGELIQKAYPFHPGLIQVFEQRWAANHDFQRTRGVLQLLATIVGDLWQRKSALPGSGLIHTSHVRFGNLDTLSTKLVSLYGNGYSAVLTADIGGPNSNAYRIDDDNVEMGKHELAQGVTATMMLASFGGDTANKGLSSGEVKQFVLTPDGPSQYLVDTVLADLESRAHYLHYASAGKQGKRYWFHTKANINILVNEAKNQVRDGDINAEVIDRLETSVRGVTKFRCIVNPNDEIPEQKRLTLMILPPQLRTEPDRLNRNARNKVLKIANSRGNSDRSFKNTILYLLASEVGFLKLQECTRAYLATKKIKTDFGGLEPDQRQTILNRLNEADKEVTKAILNAYTVVVRVEKGEPRTLSMLSFAGTLQQQLNTTLIELLKDESWLLGKVGLRTFERGKLLPAPGAPIAAKRIYEAYLRYDNYPMITGKDAIEVSLLKYLDSGDIAMASGNPPEFSRYITNGSDLLRFDAEDENMYVVHLDDVPRKEPLPSTPEPSGAVAGAGEVGGAGAGFTPTSPSNPGHTGSVGQPATESAQQLIHKLVIDGKIDPHQFFSIYPSLIAPFINNDVSIELTVKAYSTKDEPIVKGEQRMKLLEEAARQLGITVREE